MKKILFIGHEASLSGAPLVLLNLAKWLKNNRSEIIIDILLLENGDYLNDYNQIFRQVYFLNKSHSSTIVSRAIDRIKSKIGLSHKDLVLKKIKQQNYHILYGNTVVTLNWGVVLKSILPGVKLIIHLHELNGVIRMLAPNFLEHVNQVDKFICVSKAVVSNLISTYQIDTNKIKLVYEFIDIAKISSLNGGVENKSYFKVGASGYVDWRKGYDLFILTAYQFRKLYPDADIRFQWIGNIPHDEQIILSEDIKKLKLDDAVNFSGKSFTPLDEFSSFDIMLLLSREDPFPLVCLEAGSLGKPVICFDKAGGIPELLADGGGIIVPYLDVEEVVKAIYLYYTNRDKVYTDGQILKNKVVNYDVTLLAPAIVETLEDYI